ncbi:chitin synthase chs-2-like isoform X2 [Mercenaria mercenaria]|uniref:chitin synthase chs-2-like isoform X2 n=1 Tax=Mercenaria mercenaria TaxID=6596 RepID=UPI00234E4E30|nr:chitin synthase chs-2-like isoform X2 [Mercenaria mercenaria]
MWFIQVMSTLTRHKEKAYSSKTSMVRRSLHVPEVHIFNLITLDESTVKLNRNGKVHPEQEATRERKQSINADPVPMIYLCATMWHETELEMKQLLKSLFRMDKDQWDISRCAEHPDRYNFEAHIFFDDAFTKNSSCANEFVQTFDTALKSLTSTSKNKTMKTLPKEVTPYGGKLKWILPYGNKLIAHLKDEKKIRKKKRWSQVMYMYYFLSYKLGVNYKEKEFEMEREFEKLKEKAKSIFILALDGDVDFKPAAVKLLVDRMKRNEEVGAACGRIHPIGEGPMVWYQKFEYAVSHWLVKATEHVAGCVLCSPGCFSLFRGSSLMDAKVLKVYTTSSTEARHHIQYDQGEDRWLCTLLLKQGYKIDYCAASDAYTFAPEEFKVFFNQRRRWTPSTMANIMDLLSDWRSVTKRNNYVTLPYIGLQAFWFLSSLVTPGVLLLMIVGAINLIYSDLSLIGSLLINLIPIVVFVLLCFFGSTDHQLNFAAASSVVYSLVMMIVLIGLINESVKQGFCSITTPFFLSVCGIFVITGLMHPQEMSCLLHGLLFFIAIPSMSILLMIYSIINMNNVSWGTREAQQILAKGHISSKNRFQSFLDKIGCSSIPQDQNNEDIEGQPQQDEHVHKASLSFEREGTRNREEDEFWKWLINTYLHPSGSSPNTDIDEEEESRCIEENLKKKELELKHLRNKASLAFLLINGIFTTTLFFLQKINADNKGDLSIQLTCLDGRSLHLEPISMTFTLVFGILLTVQFVCMIVHRFKTFLQINSITRIRQHPDIDSLCLDIGDEQKEDEHHDDCIKQDTSAENENALGPLERTNAKKKTKSKGKKKKYRRSNTSNVEPSTSDQVLSRVDQKEKNDIDSVGGKYNTIPVQSTFTAKTPLPDIARSYPLPDIHIKHNAENQSSLDIPPINT